MLPRTDHILTNRAWYAETSTAKLRMVCEVCLETLGLFKVSRDPYFKSLYSLTLLHFFVLACISWFIGLCSALLFTSLCIGNLRGPLQKYWLYRGRKGTFPHVPDRPEVQVPEHTRLGPSFCCNWRFDDSKHVAVMRKRGNWKGGKHLKSLTS